MNKNKPPRVTLHQEQITYRVECGDKVIGRCTLKGEPWNGMQELKMNDGSKMIVTDSFSMPTEFLSLIDVPLVVSVVLASDTIIDEIVDATSVMVGAAK